jgi:hypothetical protein
MPCPLTLDSSVSDNGFICAEAEGAAIRPSTRKKAGIEWLMERRRAKESETARDMSAGRSSHIRD